MDSKTVPFSGERISPTAAIASILNSYPFSVGLFRELLQNSDDAKATKQIFVLDTRHHPSSSLYHCDLADSQGPALLAFNNEIFSDQDWEAIQTIYESSKTTDTSKIGKYGIGFRSCYHVTDNPQILSGSTLAIFDPHCGFTTSGGATIDVTENLERYCDQLSPFEFFLPYHALSSKPFSGTIVRLPLRTSAGPAGPLPTSLIKNAVVEPAEVRQLLQDFIDGELDIAMLFLTNISSIEIYEVNNEGRKRLAHAKLSKYPLERLNLSAADDAMTYQCRISTLIAGANVIEDSWRIFHASFLQSHSVSILSERINNDVSRVLTTQKLSPKVALAMPLSTKRIASNSGRLFTYLPLPLHTGFPCHIHGLFALTPDRQHLRNSEETGLVPGSTDAVLVEWNRLLLDTYVPHAWAELLPVLLTSDHLQDAFALWPPFQPIVQGGDTTYWSCIPLHFLRVIISLKLRIWPVFDASGDFSNLESILVASTTDQVKTLHALKAAAVNITLPPKYVKDLLDDSNIEYTSLSPNAAYGSMLTDLPHVTRLQSSPHHLDIVLEYLLSNKDLTNIIGLPLIKLATGEFVSLSPFNASAVKLHTLLQCADYAVFQKCDEQAIPLHQLPLSVANLLLENGPAILNVARLTPERVVEYIRLSMSGFGLAMDANTPLVVSLQALCWLRDLWEWLGKWHDQDPLYKLICDLPLVPTDKMLVPPRKGVFSRLNKRKDLQGALEMFGICFLHPGVRDIFYRALEKQGIIRSPHSIHDVLNNVSIHPQPFDVQTANVLRAHLVSQSTRSLIEKGTLNTNQQEVLRSLPIYPILVPPVVPTDSPNATSRIGAIAISKAILCVKSMPLLPIIRDTIFVDDCHTLLEIAGFTSKINHTGEILSFAIPHLSEQPKHLQRAFVHYFVVNKDNITGKLLKELASTRFVPAGSGLSQSAPKDLVDPDSELASLLQPDHLRIPHRVHEDDHAIVGDLRRLQFLQAKLDSAFVEERIAHISKNDDSDLARRLVRLIVASKFNCSNLRLTPGLCWLPTAAGNRGLQHCHHGDAHHPSLFDEVLLTLDAPSLSHSLRDALRWNEPLQLNIVKNQFMQVLEKKQHHKLSVIVMELGSRVDELSDQDCADLCHAIGDREWVPISDNCTVTTTHAIFSPLSRSLHGFHIIPPTLSDVAGKFLKRMGCAERPSKGTLTDELRILATEVPSTRTTNKALVLLEVLSETGLNVDTTILIPDANHKLMPQDRIFYNDLASHSFMVDLPMRHSIAHPKLSRDLALRLEIRFLSLAGLDSLDDDDEDMGEQLTTRIGGVLRQYTMEQAFTEFLSNAADANARVLNVLVDEKLFTHSHVLSPALAQFQELPALVIHNDATFTTNDFKGIRRIGRGGKEERMDTIGQFGLGALSMYHFTEVAMIVSGDRVMFLDPSKEYLALSKASVLLPISHIRRLYPDHLRPLDGLFGFCMDDDFYDGTLFRLPLRSPNQVKSSQLSKKPLTARDVLDLVLHNYWETAKEAPLFTELDTLKAMHREESGRLSQHWFIDGHRRDSNNDVDGFTFHCIDITGEGPSRMAYNTKWQLVATETMHRDLPPDFQPLIRKHRLREPMLTGLAANIALLPTESKIFAGLPLPLLTSLPVHLNGSFILAEDRRSIRFDGDGQVNPESRYNRWFLSEVVPPLYIFLLDIFLQSHQGPKHWCQWWPGTRPRQDVITGAVVEGFYQHLLRTTRRICLDLAGGKLQPRQARLLEDPTSQSPVNKFCQELKPHRMVILPSHTIRQQALKAGMDHVDPPLIKQEIMSNANWVVQAFNCGQLTFDDLDGIIQYLLNSGISNLVGLRLLPLADGQLTTIEYTNTTETHYYWKYLSRHRNLFPLRYFVDPRFKANTLVEAGRLNIEALNSSAVQKLVREKFSESPVRSPVTADEQSWIRSFWSSYILMPLKAQDVQDFPLVTTSDPTKNISLQYLGLNDGVFLADDSADDWLVNTLTKLGAIIVRKQQCLAPLSSFLSGKKTSPIGLMVVLPFLRDLGASEMLQLLKRDDYSLLAQWLRNQVRYMEKKTVRAAHFLRIWPTIPNDDTVSYVTATEAHMLPAGVTRAMVIPFMPEHSVLVEYSSSLVQLQIKPVNFHLIWSVLKFPNTMSHAETEHYVALLRLLFRSSCRPTLNVPNALGRMVQTDTLFGTSERLFREAFLTRPYRLLHRDLHNLESDLTNFGLTTRLDFASFKACVTVIHEDIDGEARVHRASLLFQWYSDRLPIHNAGQQSSWRELDSLRFIPRDIDRQQEMIAALDTHVAVGNLPNLVAPMDILRPDLESVAWTQRALFLIPPSERLLIADLQLGVPSITQVVEHLRILASMSADNPRVLTDLTETYAWLDARKDDPNLDYIKKYKDECIFLNVDNPRLDRWTWHCAHNMFFNIPDLDGPFACVGKFLLPFGGLLRRAGVREVSYPSREILSLSTAETQLAQIRSGINNMRLEDVLTDVTFMADDGSKFGAHSVFLATQTEYFRNLLTQGWSEGSSRLIQMSGYSGSTLKVAFDYIYTGEDIPSDVDADELVEVLRLSHYWTLSDLNEKLQDQLTEHVHLDSFDRLRDSGKQFGITTRLGDFCDRFERENQGSLNTLTGDDDVDVDADA